MKENVPNPEGKGILSKVHEELYTRLREEYNLPSKVAEDCYRDALSIYKGWFNNPKKGRFPRKSALAYIHPTPHEALCSLHPQ